MRRVARSTLARTVDPAWIWDPDLSRILWANQAGLAFWGETDVADLFERRFAADGELSEAMRAARTSLDEVDEAEIALLLHPLGDPVEVVCRVCETDLPGLRRGLAVVATVAASGPTAAPARYREMIARAPVALALFDETGAAITQNDQAEALFGARRQPLLIDRYEDRELGRRALRTALIEGFFSHTQPLATARDPRRLRIALTRFNDPVSGAPAVLGAFWDAPPVDEASAPRAKALGKLSKDGLAEALDGVAHGLAFFDGDDLRLLYANAASERLIGLPAETDDAEAALAALPLSERARLTDAFETLRAGSEDTTELDLAQVSGPSRGPWLRAKLSLQRAHDPAMLVMSLTDLGRERRTLLRLKLAEDERAEAIESLGFGLVFIDSAGAIRAASNAARRLLGAEPAVPGASGDALSGRILSELLATPDAQKLGEYLRAGPLAAGRRFETGATVTLSGLDGVPRRARLAITAPNRRNRGRRCVALTPVAAPTPTAIPDAAEAAAAEALLRAALLARAGHDLREPLTSVRGFAEMILADAELPAQLAGYAESVKVAADEMAAEIDAMLASGADEPTTPRLRSALAPVDLGALAESLVERLRAERGEAAERIRIDAAPKLAAKTDAAALGEALDVLLRRALAEGGPPGRRPVLRIFRDAAGAPCVELSEGVLDVPDAELRATAAPDPARRTALRLAELLVEKAGARLERSTEQAGAERLEIVFANPSA